MKLLLKSEKQILLGLLWLAPIAPQLILFAYGLNDGNFFWQYLVSIGVWFLAFGFLFLEEYATVRLEKDALIFAARGKKYVVKHGEIAFIEEFRDYLKPLKTHRFVVHLYEKGKVPQRLLVIENKKLENDQTLLGEIEVVRRVIVG